MVKVKSSNPRVRDRLNVMNSRMRTADGKTHYKINPETCPKTVNDYNKVESLPDGRINKDQEKVGLVHLSDAQGYLMCYGYNLKSGKVNYNANWN